jgi:signal transduction histidine kinase
MSKPQILVVEDDRHLIEGIREILEINGYEVMTANNGEAGLEILRSYPKPPDLIVSDIMMPRMDGYDFCKEVRSLDKWAVIPFIFLTAKGERDDIKRGKSLGVDDYVVKPFDAEELLIVVKAKLETQQIRQKVWQDEVSNVKHNILTILNHEFRTPLTYVVAYADMLHRDADELSKEEMISFLRGINAGASRLRRLVESFILLVELETGEAADTFGWRQSLMTNYMALLRSIAVKYADLAEEKQVAIAIDVEDSLPAIKADHEYLTAALECLVDNAIKFSDKPGTVVSLSAYQEDGHVCLLVRDQGRGIPNHELKNIFQKFYQIDRNRYEDQGAGSGLAIVKGVIELHGGTIVVDSPPGEGTTFIIYLPISHPENGR